MHPVENAYMMQEKAVSSLGAPRSLSMTERLKLQRDQLQQRLQLIDEAITALEGDEKVQRAVDALSRLGGIV